jgi:hypothetical protein
MSQQKDDRTYVRLHDGFDEHPKVAGLSNKAFRTYIEALCYCSRNLTDGQISFAVAKKLAPPHVWAELHCSGLVEVPGEVRDGYVLHDYLEHQRSADQVKQYKEAKRTAGSKGGKARAAAQAESKQMLKQTSKQTGSKFNPETETETEKELGARKRGAPAPTDFEITDAMRAWAQNNAAGINLDSETPRFLDHHRAKGSKFSDWTAAWRNWMSKAVEYASNGNGQAPNLRSVGGMTAEERYQDDQDRMAHRGRYKPPPKPPEEAVWSDELNGWAVDGKLWEAKR